MEIENVLGRLDEIFRCYFGEPHLPKGEVETRIMGNGNLMVKINDFGIEIGKDLEVRAAGISQADQKR